MSPTWLICVVRYDACACGCVSAFLFLSLSLADLNVPFTATNLRINGWLVARHFIPLSSQRRTGVDRLLLRIGHRQRCICYLFVLYTTAPGESACREHKTHTHAHTHTRGRLRISTGNATAIQTFCANISLKRQPQNPERERAQFVRNISATDEIMLFVSHAIIPGPGHARHTHKQSEK